MVFAIERRRDLVTERAQIFNCKDALLAAAQVVHRHLQRLTGQVLINVLRNLGWREMRAGVSVFTKRLLVEREKSGFAVQRCFEALAAAFTGVQVVADG